MRTTLKPETVEDLKDAVSRHAPVLPRGRSTKAPLGAAPDNVARLDMTAFSGITEYEPDEFTFTAGAGTSLLEIERTLAENGQYLPFEPPFIDEGATLGGTVAAGLSGSGRLRYGGIRDFIIGVHFVDGTGKLVHGGGKVVKNAAGFDLPKLMVGSMGRLGALVDVTFKVFPAPMARRSIRVACRDLADAIEVMTSLARKPLDPEAMDLEPPSTLMLRVAGNEASIDRHADRVARTADRPFEILNADEALAYWEAGRNFKWAPDNHLLIKVALTTARLGALEAALSSANPVRRYAVAGNVAWIAWPPDRPLAELDLAGLGGLVIHGPLPSGAIPRIGAARPGDTAFANCIKSALDPQGRFSPLIQAESGALCR